MSSELQVKGAECFEGLAAAAAAEEQPLRAARLIGTAHSLREDLGTPGESDRTAFERVVADVQQALGAEAFAAAWAGGRALALEEAIAEALQEDESA